MIKTFYENWRSDFWAGITVGIVALPLSMALAIATGVPPQHGLYTAIVAGVVIAICGGSRVNISGPTAAFVVVLQPIVHQHGLGGLLIAGLLAGLILMALGAARLGRFIAMVPYPVTVGFTAGIGVVIATLQIKDLLGLPLPQLEGEYLHKAGLLLAALPQLRWQDALIGAVTLAVLIGWPMLKTRVPQHLVALLAGTLLAWALEHYWQGFSVATISSRFHYEVGGVTGTGIPPMLPRFEWPWLQAGPAGQPLVLSFELIQSLLQPAFAIAMLGALESLLCAVVADGMTGMRHDSNRELIGQGIGNMLVPFFGGIPATAAIARTATNIRSGGRSPAAGVIHGLFVLLSLLVLTPMLGHIPMASMAALLLLVAWNMSDAHHFVHIVRSAPRGDIAVLLCCFLLTVLIDMTVAVTVGIMLAAVLFIRRMIDLTGAELVTVHTHPHLQQLPSSVAVYDIDGPLFFGAAQKALNALTNVRQEIKVVILDMSDVSMIDMTAMVAMESMLHDLHKKDIAVVINSLAPRMLLKMRRVGLRRQKGVVEFARNMPASALLAQKLLEQRTAGG
jgi:SulP family sulfate permease